MENVDSVLRTKLRNVYDRETEPGAGFKAASPLKQQKLEEYAAMMLPRKLKEESGTFWRI